jgi:excisionase family DNA binding protein
MTAGVTTIEDGDDNEALTVKDVCAVLNVSKDTVYGLIEGGDLVGFRIGVGKGQYRIRRTKLTEYIETKEKVESKKHARLRSAKKPDKEGQ